MGRAEGARVRVGEFSKEGFVTLMERTVGLGAGGMEISTEDYGAK
jgi:hypothetical protein